MENKESNTPLKNFVIKAAIVDLGLIALAAFISITQSLNFALVLLVVGIVIGGIGNLLAGPSLANRQHGHDLISSTRPNETLSNRISAYLTYSIPHYGFENVMMYSGLVAIAISIPFLLMLMFF